MRGKELARTAALNACKRHNLQFLDDTVSMRRIRFLRSSHGRLQLARKYVFEFSSQGINRHGGHLWVCGGRAYDLEMEPYPEPPQE